MRAGKGRARGDAVTCGHGPRHAMPEHGGSETHKRDAVQPAELQRRSPPRIPVARLALLHGQCRSAAPASPRGMVAAGARQARPRGARAKDNIRRGGGKGQRRQRPCRGAVRGDERGDERCPVPHALLSCSCIGNSFKSRNTTVPISTNHFDNHFVLGAVDRGVTRAVQARRQPAADHAEEEARQKEVSAERCRAGGALRRPAPRACCLCTAPPRALGGGFLTQAGGAVACTRGGARLWRVVRGMLCRPRGAARATAPLVVAPSRWPAASQRLRRGCWLCPAGAATAAARECARVDSRLGARARYALRDGVASEHARLQRERPASAATLQSRCPAGAVASTGNHQPVADPSVRRDK